MWIVVRKVLAAQLTSRPAKPASAHMNRQLGAVRYKPSKAPLAPSRPCTPAATTVTVMSRPNVSVTMNRLRPATFFPAS